MRYYDIKIASANPPRHWTTHPDGLNKPPDPGALNVEIDAPIYPFATPDGSGQGGGAFVSIWGVALPDIGQAADFSFKDIVVAAGFGKGLPLAKPDQAGVILQGQIQASFGNWRGTEMALNFMVTSATWLVNQYINITVNWKQGTPLADAIRTTLNTAFPNVTPTINIKPLMLAHDEKAFFGSLAQFAAYVKGLSADAFNDPHYQGVDIVLRENKFIVYDQPTVDKPKEIKFEDLIGQPTWVRAGIINFVCPMRADIGVGDVVKLPPTIATTAAQAYPQYKDGSSFSDVVGIQRIRHVGNSRFPSGNSWATSYEAYFMQKPIAATASASDSTTRHLAREQAGG